MKNLFTSLHLHGFYKTVGAIKQWTKLVFWDVTLQNTSTPTLECGKTSQETVILAPYNVKTHLINEQFCTINTIHKNTDFETQLLIAKCSWLLANYV